MKKSTASSCYNEDTPLMRSGITLYNNNNAPAAIIKDIETRLQVVTKVVPQEDVAEAYNEFIQKLNGLCYERLAEQLVRPIKPLSTNGAPSVYDVVSSQNVQSSQVSNKYYNMNPSSKSNFDSTSNRIMKAAAEVRKQNLTTINETANSNATISSQRQKKGRLPNSRKPLPQDPDDTSQYFRAPKTPKPSRSKAVSMPKRKKKYADEISITAAELTITKSSLRNNSVVVYTTTQRRNYRKVHAAKAPASEKDVSMSSNGTFDNSIQTSNNSQRSVYDIPKKTALSPFFNRIQKHRINANSTPLGKF